MSRMKLSVITPSLRTTERPGRVVNIPASYSLSPGLKPRPEDRLS
jgi:hypothetical protein